MAYQDLLNKRSAYFQGKRQENQMEAGKATQEGDDALARRFASLNMQGSGASVAAGLKNREQVGDTLRKANLDVTNQELQAGEGDIQRAYGSEESQKGRDFTGNESRLAREMQGGQFGQQLAFNEKTAAENQANKLQEIELAKQQFALDKDTTEFNKRMAEIEANRPASGGLGGLTNITDKIHQAADKIPGSKEIRTIFSPLTEVILPNLGGGGK